MSGFYLAGLAVPDMWHTLADIETAAREWNRRQLDGPAALSLVAISGLLAELRPAFVLQYDFPVRYETAAAVADGAAGLLALTGYYLDTVAIPLADASVAGVHVTLPADDHAWLAEFGPRQTWPITPAIPPEKLRWVVNHVLRVDQPGMQTALALLWRSHDQMTIGPCDEDLLFADQAPRIMSQRYALDDAVLNAYKAIEALLDGVPRDETRLSAKLAELGIAPSYEVGMGETPLTLARAILTVDETIRGQSAHGRAWGSHVTYAQAFSAQVVATNVLRAAIQALDEPGHLVTVVPAI